MKVFIAIIDVSQVEGTEEWEKNNDRLSAFTITSLGPSSVIPNSEAWTVKGVDANSVRKKVKMAIGEFKVEILRITELYEER